MHGTILVVVAVEIFNKGHMVEVRLPRENESHKHRYESDSNTQHGGLEYGVITTEPSEYPCIIRDLLIRMLTRKRLTMC